MASENVPHRISLIWRKSTRSASDGNCVEIAVAARAVAVRDSTQPDAGALIFGRRPWSEFVTELKQGIYDVGSDR
jgi:hypothetical protein